MSGKRQDLIAAYPEGKIVDCIVTRVEPFGVFVHPESSLQVGGFIHRRDWDWHRQTFDLTRTVTPGATVTARVMKHERNSLRLSRRQAIPDPYPTFRKRHRIGDAVLGQVKLLAQKSAGVVVSLEDGVEGFIPRSEIPEAGLHEDGFGLFAQDLVAARIIRFDQKEVVLSIKEHLRAREQAHAATESDSRAALRHHPEVGLDLQQLYWSLQLREFTEPEISPALRERIRRILVVEDCDSVSESLEMVLGHFGFACDLACTLEEARSRLAEHRYDLLILDINLPAASGAELIAHLRGITDLVYVFVLTATAADQWSELLAQTTDPVACVFQKPTSITRILEQLNRQVAHQATADDRCHPVGVNPGDLEEEAAIPWAGRGSASERREKIERILAQLRRDTGASQAFVLSFRPGPIFELVAGDFPELTREVQQSLEVSPIGNVIRERSFLDVADVAQRKSQFKHLVEVCPLGSFAGLALDYADQAAYGLFLIGTQADQLTQVSESVLRAASVRVRHHLAEGRFEDVIAENQGLLLTGFLADSLLHEIKNELQALDDFSAVNLLLCNRYPDDLGAMGKEERLNFTRATVGVRQVSQRLNEIIVLFRNLAGHSPAERLDVNQAIRRLRETLRPFADDKGATIEADLDEEVPEFVVNPKLVDQPILNIMINGLEQMAIHRASPRRLQVTTRYFPDADFPVRITITDTGRGIHFVDGEKIFDLFYTTKQHGTGLGLFISRFFVERFGGRLTLASSLMFSGTEFTLEIPREVVA